MASLTIRNLPEKVRNKLRVRAAQRGLSMEAEARAILTSAVASPAPEPPDQSWNALQDWIADHRHPPRSEKSGVVALRRDRRREAILDVIADGRDPSQIFGSLYARVLSEAGWTKARVRQLSRSKT